jgi:hypothetical protein
MVQDDGLAGARNRSDGSKRFIKGFSGDESPSEAVFCAQAPDPIGYRLFGRQPKDQIAEGVRGSRLFL